MRMLVCGGRKFGIARHEHDFIICSLDTIVYERLMGVDIEVISGMATGVDSVAISWALRHKFKIHAFHAKWKVYGKAAGRIRNQEALDEGKPDMVVSFEGGTGTEHMVSIAKLAGIEVIDLRLKCVQ